MNHCALNVALYGPRHRRWAMTERGAGVCTRDVDTFAIGPSALTWRSDALVIDIDEITAPFPRRLRGRVTVRPRTMFGTVFDLDGQLRHRWRPIAPVADVEVDMIHPGLRWRGLGYLDHNAGDEPLEAGFTTWDWSRAHHGSDAILHYDARSRAGTDCNLALKLKANGDIEAVAPVAMTALPKTLWRVERNARSDLAAPARVASTLEDTPFYARSVIDQRVCGHALRGFHESLDLDRFCAPVVQGMLPFRMPRRAG